MISLGHTYVFGPSLTNEFRLSFSRQYLNTHPYHPYPDSINGQSEVQKLLAPLKIPVSPLFPTPDFTMGIPGGNYSSCGQGTCNSIAIGPEGWANMQTTSDAWTFLDNFTKIIGRHTLKTGVMYRVDHDTYISAVPTSFGFGGHVVDPTTGLGASGLTEFMLGTLGSGSGGTGNDFQPYARNRYWGAYVQDTFT
jgi:hypothetical protein